MKSRANTGMATETAARKNTPIARFSTATSFARSKRRPPMVMQHMKQENTRPVGRGSFVEPRRVGTHMKTKVYMDPSNKLVLAATSKIRLSEITRQVEDWFSSFLSPM